MKIVTIIAVLILLPVAGYCGEKPTLEEVKKVLSHYYTGQGKGVYLVDLKLCRSVHENECKDEISSRKINKGEKTILWMYYFGPKEDKASIHYEFRNGGKTRKVGDFNIKGAYRYRTKINVPSSRVGEWKIDLSQEIETGDIDLGSFKYTVKENE